MDILKHLVHRVAYAFYDAPSIIVLSCLVRNRVMRDEELQAYLRLPPKEVTKICQKLRQERLIKAEGRQEFRDATKTRRITRIHYYIDYKAFVDIVKWKLWCISRNVEEGLTRMKQNMGYICPLCRKKYSPLDAMNILDPLTGIFRCEICSMELVEDEDEEGFKGKEDLYIRFMEETKPLLELLKQADELVLDDFTLTSTNIETYKESGITVTHKSNVLSTHLPYLTNIPLTSLNNALPNDIIIEFDDGTKLRQKKEQERKEELKKVNLLPIWHAVSTVTGEKLVEKSESKKVLMDEDVGMSKEELQLLDEITKYYTSLVPSFPIKKDTLSIASSEISKTSEIIDVDLDNTDDDDDDEDAEDIVRRLEMEDEMIMEMGVNGGINVNGVNSMNDDGVNGLVDDATDNQDEVWVEVVQFPNGVHTLSGYAKLEMVQDDLVPVKAEPVDMDHMDMEIDVVKLEPVSNEEPIVTVAGKAYKLSQVTNDLIVDMTEQEKRVYFEKKVGLR